MLTRSDICKVECSPMYFGEHPIDVGFGLCIKLKDGLILPDSDVINVDKIDCYKNDYYCVDVLEESDSVQQNYIKFFKDLFNYLRETFDEEAVDYIKNQYKSDLSEFWPDNKNLPEEVLDGDMTKSEWVEDTEEHFGKWDLKILLTDIFNEKTKQSTESLKLFLKEKGFKSIKRIAKKKVDNGICRTFLADGETVHIITDKTDVDIIDYKA